MKNLMYKSFRPIKRIYELGISGLALKAQDKAIKIIFDLSWKKKALQKKAGHSWNDIQKGQTDGNFRMFFEQVCHDDPVTTILSSPLFSSLRIYRTPEFLTEQTDHIIHNCLPLLGLSKMPCHIESSHCHEYQPKKISWHHDVKHRHLNFIGFKTSRYSLLDTTHARESYFRSISLPSSLSKDPDEYTSDVKVPWEQSRFHHLFNLAEAYQNAIIKNEHNLAKTYEKTFVQHVSSWLENNPFLLGINWMSPMDVSIRAINLLWCFNLFKQSTSISNDFWQQLICSLYDHLIYLKDNYHLCDKPNNHLLTEQLGYLYLCSFFKSLGRFKEELELTTTKLEQLFAQQINADGTSYEGSTAYHRLDAELYLHFYLLTKDSSEKDDPSKMLNRMINFLRDCTDESGKLITIGDDDSSKLVTGLCIKPQSANGIKTYSDFGITIIRESGWHITFRHPTFKQRQPTGHFHADSLSFTVTVGEQPILVDPASFIYTANSYWRNLFRSAAYHNTFYIPDVEEDTSSRDLFQMNRTPHPQATGAHQENDQLIIRETEFVKKKQLNLCRSLIFNQTTETVEWNDSVEGTENASPLIEWNLIFHPSITLNQEDTFSWIIQDDSHKKLAHLNSTLIFDQSDGFFAPSYGTKIVCPRLTSRKHYEHPEDSLIRLI